MSMITLASAREKLLPGANSVNWLDRTPSTRTSAERKTSKVPVIRQLPQSIPVKGVSRPIEVKFASTESEWEQAFALAAAKYSARGYESPGASHLRFTPHHALPDTRTLVAKHEGKVVAMFSIVMDNRLLGLPMEEVYPEEIASLRQEGRRIGETTTLADAGLGVREFIQVFVALIKLAMQYHRNQGGDTPVIAVNPRHRQFYTKMLGFQPLGPRRSYAAVQDAPAEAFWVDYDLLKANAPKLYEEIFGEDVPWETLFAPKMPRHLMRQFSRQSNLCNPDQIEEILSFTESSLAA
jgi:hypothetical protein